eukprot:CAMPEP_0198274972 /NCGR_PEP_ID=MMETSP1447-20131203/62601_1 /TAXON_ID=420782 /ORGANISM="Chaetoceros dichaeta, Strain CCMP1751" /LENGTH=81 /DNA_ID=CAMNT_0043969483 /DNA_START=79 /DNA_END=320 /DNA_ORIENTATION=+
MASMRVAPRKSPTYGGVGSNNDNNLVPTRRMRRRGGSNTVSTTRRLRRQRKTYKTLFIICSGILVFALVFIVRQSKSDGLG